MHTEAFTIIYEFYQVPSYMPSSPLGVYKPLLILNNVSIQFLDR